MPNDYLSQVHVDNKNYKIKDFELRQRLNSLSADSIAYDSSSIISADDVQEAIDSILTVLQPILIITAPVGSSITIENGTTIITGVATSGTFTTEIPTFGTWTITATLNSRTTTDTISITELGRGYEVELEFFSATLSITTDSGAEVYLNGVSKGIATSGTLSIPITKSGTYTVSSEINGVSSEEWTTIFTTDGETISKTLDFRKISLTAPSGSSITLTDGDTTYTDTSVGTATIYYIPNDGTWTATATLSGKTASDSVIVSAYQIYSIELVFANIYGVEWDGSSSPALSRTDESALFVDPDPYMADGNHPGSSPFDNLMPWSGMVKKTIGTDVFVKIPKFWFKVTTNGTNRKIQIADRAVTGFSVSPAHQDRGDGVGERDYVYVSRYHVSSGYKSVSGVNPLGGITKIEARTGCTGRGTGYYQFDMMTLITIWYLYLVEFAHWDSQAKIGYGGGNGAAKQNTGASDSMPYHTGTMKSSRTLQGVGTQYRWIEDLWGNVLDWIDGIYFSSANIYAIKNPTNFSDSSGGTLVGTRPTASNEIKAWKDSTVSGYEWFVYPSEVYSDSSYATYCCDSMSYSSSGTALFFGGYYSSSKSSGLFSLNGNYTQSTYSPIVGARLLYLP